MAMTWMDAIIGRRTVRQRHPLDRAVQELYVARAPTYSRCAGPGPACRHQLVHGGSPDHHLNRLDTGKKIRNHVRQLEALGLTVTLTQAA
ncbi:hypothetical protein ETD86_00680 [Nonomuraea turkmeniaca]|uniref:Uncharacterized protein n=1 Tax=Nonomuraea turkmeniaca TaxID=103838 RepID=A0A5S4FZH3_9ACTN|nr:hypothetical protein ETD86_00680 [Nonomuraea turkmeniaca]